MTTATTNEALFRSLLKARLGLDELAQRGLLHEEESNHLVERTLETAGIDFEEWNEWVQG